MHTYTEIKLLYVFKGQFIKQHLIQFTAQTVTVSRTLEASYETFWAVANSGKSLIIGVKKNFPSMLAFLKTVLKKIM